MISVTWTPALLGRFVKAIDEAKKAAQLDFHFPVDTRFGTHTLHFSVDYAEFLADHLSTGFAADAAVQ